MAETREPIERFRIPGTESECLIERDDEGRLTRLTAGGRIYAEACDDRIILGDGFAEISEATLPNGLLRRVHTSRGDWVEEYFWDSDRKPTSIDGTRIERDSHGRVTACRSDKATWRYGYSGNQLSVIDGPFGTRHIVRADDGRPVRVRETGQTEDFRYCATGARSDSCGQPGGFHYDPMGRLWTVTDPYGRIQHTYLWNGLACFGRIDGPPGNPLAVVFSLDPTSTPVRIISRTNVTQIARDAFGESLLDHDGIPGLYSSAIRNGLMHFRSRKLDPRTGSYTSPDPLCGTERDPRRLKGFQGPLFVDNAQYGPYAVCQYDPIGRTDPTGEFSFPLFLSSLTWAWGTNVFSILVMDATLNFWLSLFGFGQGDDVRGRFWDFEGLSASDRIGSVAFRRDGFWTKHDDSRAWTFQHTFYADQTDDVTKQSGTIMDPLDFGRVFKPSTDFVPSLYGTLLKLLPDTVTSAAFILQGSYNTPGDPSPAAGAEFAGWGRYGGAAVKTIPGSRVPRFPGGGFHFGERQRIKSGATATLFEADPGAPVTGKLKNLVKIIHVRAAPEVKAGDIVFFTDDAGNAGVFTLTAVDKDAHGNTYHAEPNYIPFKVDPVLGASGRMRTVAAAAKSTENLSKAKNLNGDPIHDRFDLPAAGADYASEDPLRFSQSASELAAATVKASPASFEVQLVLDAAIDATLVSPPDLQVSLAVKDGAVGLVSAKTQLVPDKPSLVDFSPSNAPAAPAGGLPGTLAKPGGGGPTIPVVLRPTGDPKILEADRTLDSLGATNTSVRFQQFKKDAALGKRSVVPETTASITYTPDKPRTAPTTGFVLVEDSAGRITCRQILSKGYDALVLTAAVPAGNPGIPYSVEVLTYDGKLDISPCNFNFKQEIQLDTATDLSGFDAFQVFRLQTAKIDDSLSTRSINGATLTGATASIAVAPNSLPNQPNPGQVVAVKQPAGTKIAVVKNVAVTFRVDRTILSANKDAFDAALLDTTKPQNDGKFLAVRQIQVLPTLGTTAGAAIPAYRRGEHVFISSDKSSGDFTIADTFGPVLILDPAVGPNLDPTGANYVITRDPSPTGWAYDARQVSATTITVFPTDRDSRLPVGATRVQMPQFRVGELVKANWGGAAPGNRHYRVKAVKGTTIDVADDADLPADTPDLVVVQLDVADQGNGTHRIGMKGAMVNPTSPSGKNQSDTFKFSVWRPVDVNAGNLISISDSAASDASESHGALVIPGVNAQIDVDFTAAPQGLSGAVDVFALKMEDQGYACAAPEQPGDHSTAAFVNTPVLSRPGGGMVIIVPFTKTQTVTGTVTAGTQRVPEEIGFEISRRQTLIDHELTHTRQALEWGPLMFCYFPVWLLEFIGDIATDQNLPRFTEYVEGSLSRDGGRTLLKIADGAKVTFKVDDRVEISLGDKPEQYKLGESTDKGFAVAHNAGPTADRFDNIDGVVKVFVRKVQGGGTAAAFWDWFMASQRLLTVGGLSKIGFGGIWGGFAFLVGKFFYFIYRKVLGGEDDTEHGIVNKDKKGIQFANINSTKFKDAAIIRVKKGDDIRIREVEKIDVDHIGGFPPPDPDALSQPAFLVIHLKTEIDLEGDVEVAPFSTQNMFSQWDWNSYYPARIPDDTRPARIKVEPIGKDTLTLRQFDRVFVTDETTSQTCYVNNVEADGTIDLNRAPFSTTPKPDHLFQVASAGVIQNTALAELNPESTGGKVGEGVLTAFFDPLNVLHMSWMRYLIDPFGQFKPEAYRRGLRPDSGWGAFFTGLTYLARYGLSTESWGLLPFFGYFWWDHVFGGKSGDKDYLAEMEQDASQESGNIYSHLSRLANKPSSVGDIGQFWFFVHGGYDFAIGTSERDAPGVHARTFVRICPLAADSGAGTGVDLEPNVGFETPDASKDSAGLILPDVFTRKPGIAPNSAPASSPRAWQPSNLAQIPVNQELQAAIGTYFAFSEPGTHRITIRNDASEARPGEVQRAKKHTLGIFENDDTLQTVFFDVTVTDVIVTFSGIQIANGDVITLLQRQRMPFIVRDQFGRDFTTSHLVFTSESSLGITGGDKELAAGKANGQEQVEVLKTYAFNKDSKKFDSDLIGPGMHLAEDNLRIPVRNFSVRVTGQPAVVKTMPDKIPLNLYDDTPELHANETVFVLIPSPFIKKDDATFDYGATPPNPLPPNPSVTVDVLTDLTSFSQSVKDFIGLDGRILSVKLKPDPAPAGDPLLSIPITVGPASDSTIVTATIRLKA